MWQHPFLDFQFVSVTVPVFDAALEHQTLWSKGCEFESWQEWRENSFLQSKLCVLTLIRCWFLSHITAVARKRPWSFCQKCRWSVTPKHAYTLDPTKSELGDCATVQAWCENLSRKELTRNLSGNTQPQSSWLPNFPQILAKEEKSRY